MAGPAVSEIGSVGEEAARLIEAAADWLRSRAGEDGHDAATCRLCPLCRVLGVARTAQPETFEHVLAAVESLTAAARTLVETRAGQPTPGVQHIDIG
jgi:hypothetical protein